MPEAKLKSKIRNFIYTNFLFADLKETLKDEQSFIDNGIMDSTGVLELISFIEENFEIKIEDEELTPENLDSVNKLTKFIQQKMGNKLIVV